MRTLLLLLAAVFFALACGPAFVRVDAPVLIVENEHPALMRVYEGVVGVPLRLGEVETGRRELFTLHRYDAGACGITLQAAASRDRWTYGPFLCAPDDTFYLRVTSAPQMTFPVKRP